MESDWIEYKCKSGQTIFIYNKVTGVHKWPPGFNNGSSEDSIMYGQPVEYKELHSIATQTDDYGCNNGCSSMYINTDLHHVSNISETLPQPQPGISVDGELDFENEHDPENTLEDEQEQRLQDMGETLFRVPGEFCPGSNLVGKENEAKDYYASDDNSERRQLHEREGYSSHYSEESLKCSYCAMQLKNKSTLIIHLRTHTGEKPFACSYCEKKFAHKGHFKNHLRLHTGEKPFECSYCEKKFTIKCNLKKHLRIHTGEKPFKCSYCKKNFTEKGALKIHCTAVHTGEKPFECSHCKKKFARKGDLKKHLIRQTGEKPFECSYCKKKFTEKSNLKKHLRVHTGEKPFECSYCNKKLAHRVSLKNHLRMHAGEKPFECSHCKKKFIYRYSLKRHLALH